MSDHPLDAGDNVVKLPSAIAAEGERVSPPEQPTLENLLEFCNRLEEGMQYVAQTLVAMDSRLRRLELAQNKAEREKAKPTILNMHGEKAI